MPVPGEVTDPTAIRTEDARIPVDGGHLDGYLATPSREGVNPGIIVIHEAFGPIDHIHDLARRFANAGFLALAPNLYTRIGAPDPNDRPEVLEKMFSLPDSQIVEDIEAVAGFLRSRSDANGKVGCIGFCSGGRQTLLFACSSDKVDAAVDCWGGFIAKASWDENTTPNRPTRIIDLVENLGCPLLAVGGAEDQNPSPDELRILEDRLKRAGKTDATVMVFEDAGHAFLADYRPDNYREIPAHRLWTQVLDFFEGHLR